MTLAQERGTTEPGRGPAAADVPTDPVSSAPPRLCGACGAALLEEQDWCVECGTAAPGRLGPSRSVKGALAVVAATVVLAGGAAVTIFASVDDSSARDAAGPTTALGGATPPQVAQVPPSYIPGKTNPSSPAGDAGSAIGSLPGVPSTDLTPSTPSVTPSFPDGSTPTFPDSSSIPSFTPSFPSTPPTGGSGSTGGPGSTGSGTSGSGSDADSGSGSSGSSSSGSGGSSSGNSGENAEDQGPDTSALPTPTPLSLTSATDDIFDPFGNATSKQADGRAIDGDSDTSATFDIRSGDEDPQVGLQIDLSTVKRIRGITLTTSTPGFRAEIYTTDSSTLPKQITDPRFAHQSEADIRSVAEGTTKRLLDGIGPRTRHVVIWITRPPANGRTVKISEVQLLGSGG